MSTTYALAAVPPPSGPPALDAGQQAVVDHRGGPLLVLAGPGTGKTTTLVEVVVNRVARGEVRPEQVLVLTFSRKAAGELRARVGARLARTTASPTVTTFHSFCYGLVRRAQDPEAFAAPLQLLSAPEQDSRIAEVVRTSLEDPAYARTPWPESLRPALATRGIAAELQAFMAAARGLGLDPEAVAGSARRAGRADWAAAAAFTEEYLDVLDAQNALDYAELVHRASILADEPAWRARLREEFRLVVVDEYQDTDPAQVGLLQAIAGDGRDLVAVGDPDQSIYAFRGADVGGIGRFPSEFETLHGEHARVLALTTTRRFGPRLLDASRSVVEALGAPAGIPREVVEQFRHPAPAPGAADSRVEVRTYVSAVAEAEQVAAELRRAHLHDGLDWSDMAVLVRSGADVIPRLQRALTAAGVPTEVAADEVPLRSDPAVRPLLQALRLVLSAAAGRPLDPQDALDVLAGPLGALDPTALRRVSRALRHLDPADAPDPDGSDPAEPEPVRSSRELVAEALLQPTTWTRLDVDGASTCLRLSRVLVDAAAQVAAGGTPDEVLWTLWAGTGWRARLERAVDRGGDAGRAAHRDLDAVCALFDVAARADEHRRRTGVATFLAEVEDQQIPGQPLAEAGVRGSAVRLLTAHRSKGLEWRLVVVAGVQEGSWPIVRARGSLLQPDRLAADGARPPATLAERVAEERRLFYVALTRARERLLVTAVASPYDDGEQPSRFVAALHQHLVPPPASPPPGEVRLPVPAGRPRRPLSLRGVVAELRRIAESSTDEGVRAAAADRLAVLAAPRPDGGARVPAAHPDRWPGARDTTVNALPLVAPEEPVPLSASALSAIVSCPLSWYLARQCQGEEGGTAAQGFGSLVHAVAADVVRTGAEPDAERIDARLEEFWSRLDHVAPWISARERVEARTCVERFAEWHRRREEGRTVLAGEHDFEVEVPVGGDRALLRGSMDRVELTVDGRVHVVDLKTGKHVPTSADLRVHPQLALYQLAVDHGAADDLVDGPVTSGGASLVQLRVAAGAATPEMPKVQTQAALADADPGSVLVREQVEQAVALVRSQQVTATPGAGCAYCHFARVCPAQPDGRTVLDLEVTR